MDLTKGNQHKALVLLSGGIDSACCARFLQDQGYSVKGLFVNFGQLAANGEATKAREVAKWLSCELIEANVTLPRSFTNNCSEISGRNAFLINLALMSELVDSCQIGIGIHSGTPYFDCTPDFIRAIHKQIRESTDGRWGVLAPFEHWQKQDIFDYACSLELPLDITHSCEFLSFGECGVCPSCVDREKFNC